MLTIHFEQKQLISFPSLINVNYSMLLIDFNFHALLRMRRQVKMRYDIYRIEVLLRCTGTSASLLSFTVIPVSLCFMHDLPWISLVANVFSTIVYISGQFTKYQSNVLDFFLKFIHALILTSCIIFHAISKQNYFCLKFICCFILDAPFSHYI